MKSSYLFKLIIINIGKFIFLTLTSIIVFLVSVRLGQLILIYFSHCPVDCAIETFSSMFISGIIVGLVYLYFLVKGTKNLYSTICELRTK